MSGRPAASVIIVGAGMVGVAAAVHLQRRGVAVTLVDRDEPGQGASFGNGGVLACSSVVPVPAPGLLAKVPAMLADPLGPLYLRWSYLPRLLPWLIPYLRSGTTAGVTHAARHLAPLLFDAVEQHRELAAGTPAEPRVRPSDYLYAYRSAGDFDETGLTWRLRREHGAQWETLGAAALRDLVPGIAPEYGFGVLLKRHGTIADPGAYVAELAGHVAERGGRVVRAAVTDIRAADGRAQVVTAEESLTADAVVLAAGAWSGALAARLGHRVRLESERGYHVEFLEPSVTPPVPVMVADGRCVATAMPGRLRLAGIVDFGGLDGPPSPRPLRVLHQRAGRLFPGMTFSGTRDWMGHRPATIDSLPVLGPSPKHPNVFFAFGHQHVGLSAGPKSGRLIADLVTGGTPNLDLSAYRVDRFDP